MFILGIIIGLSLAELVVGRFEGDKLERSLRFRVGDYYVHIHHWFYASLLLLLLYIVGFYHPFVYGFLAGPIIQGLTYRDRFVFIYRKDRFEEIYSKFRPKDF